MAYTNQYPNKSGYHENPQNYGSQNEYNQYCEGEHNQDDIEEEKYYKEGKFNKIQFY